MKTVDEALAKLSSSNIEFKLLVELTLNSFNCAIYYLDSLDASKIENSISFKSRFVENYQLEKLLGKGGFGYVVQATYCNDKHEYAIKRITFHNTEEKRNIQREVETQVKLDHKNIVRYYHSWSEEPPIDWMDPFKKFDDDEDEDEVNIPTMTLDIASYYRSWSKETIDLKKFDDNDDDKIISTVNLENRSYFYIQMELCNNGDLYEWLRKNDSFDKRKDQYVDIFKQIVDGLCYIHEQGLIHRDLKPKNIFFNSSNTIKIGDFGLTAKLMDCFPIDGDLRRSKFAEHTPDVGTPPYMAPEQSDYKKYTYKVDIWALGIILMELLTVFNTYTEKFKTIEALQDGKFPERILTSFPDEYKLLRLMLSREPDERLSTYGIKAHSPLNENIEEIYYFKMPQEK